MISRKVLAQATDLFAARTIVSVGSARLYSEPGKNPIKTPLYELHKKYGGKIVDFSGFLLPVQYAGDSVFNSHLHTRKHASIFDVSHMLQTLVRGKHCIPWIESICPVDLQSAADGTSALTVFLTDNGGIIDDLIVTKVDKENLYIVSNAGRIDADKEHMTKSSEKYRNENKDVQIEFLDVNRRGLIALQGPDAAKSVQALTDLSLDDLYFMNSRLATVAGVAECRVTRCGYTGEDGVEISVQADKLEHVTEALLASPSVKLAGLGARDSLRLEAGLCLYGNDIDESVTPVEANLTWLIAKRRRADRQFPGANIIMDQIKNGVSKRRVGVRIEAGAPARKDAILKFEGEEIGKVTSGCPSPSLGGNVAMGYVKESLKKADTRLEVSLRGKDISCSVAKMPFVPAKYYIKK